MSILQDPHNAQQVACMSRERESVKTFELPIMVPKGVPEVAWCAYLLKLSRAWKVRESICHVSITKQDKQPSTGVFFTELGGLVVCGAGC
jgi:hypothetical protein